jgi:hypothetical protein
MEEERTSTRSKLNLDSRLVVMACAHIRAAGYLKSLNPEVEGVTGKESCPDDPLKPYLGSTKVRASLLPHPVLQTRFSITAVAIITTSPSTPSTQTHVLVWCAESGDQRCAFRRAGGSLAQLQGHQEAGTRPSTDDGDALSLTRGCFVCAHQVFGYGPVKPPAPMTGFVRNYAENDDFVVGADIMQCFNPKTRTLCAIIVTIV